MRTTATMTRRPTTFLAAAALTALAALASVVILGTGASASTVPPTHTNTRPAAVDVAQRHSPPTVEVRNTRLGKILVNSQGHTLYLFKKDHANRAFGNGNPLQCLNVVCK